MMSPFWLRTIIIEIILPDSSLLLLINTSQYKPAKAHQRGRMATRDGGVARRSPSRGSPGHRDSHKSVTLMEAGGEKAKREISYLS